MLVSLDYTKVRQAVLSDDVIQKLIDRYPYRGGLGFTDIRKINKYVGEMMPHRQGKVDLVTEWIINSLDKGSGRWPEDSSLFINGALFFLARNPEPRFRQAVEVLSEDSGRKFNYKNILNFTLHEIYDLEDIYNAEPVDPKVNRLSKTLPEGAKFIYNGDGYQIVEVTQPEAACLLAKGTRWCTSNEKIAEDYLKGGPLYIIYLNGGKIAQFHANLDNKDFHDIQLMDLRDRPISPDEGLGTALWRSGLLQSILDSAIEMGMDYEFIEGLTHKWLRFPADDIQKFVVKSPYLSYAYAMDILEEPFPAGERAIARNGDTSFWYAYYMLHGRFPQGEPAIINSGKVFDYIRFLFTKKKEEYESFIYQYRDNPVIKKYLSNKTSIL
jgi:hypothetical protein